MERQGRTSKIANVAPALCLNMPCRCINCTAMRLLFIIALNYLLLNTTAGQPGFSKWFDFGSAANFHNMVLKEDTLIIAGTSKDLSANQWGALFVKMDTNGLVLDSRLHLDTMDGQFAFDQGYPFITTSDGGYLLVGKVFNRESYFIYKLDLNGDIEFFKEYFEPPDILTILPRQIIEIEDGYLICNNAQLQNGLEDIQVVKINSTGEIVWEQFYGEYSRGELVGSIWQDDEKTIVLGCQKPTDEYVNFPSPLRCQSDWIFAIDSLGGIKWEWLSEPCEGRNIIGLHRTVDGGWIYATQRLEAFDQWNWGSAPKFVKRDSQFNLLWERQVAESYWEANEMIDLKPTPDGNWVGAGLWLLPEPYTPLMPGYFYSPGCLFKVDEQGNSLWVRCDTAAMENHTLYHRYGGIVVLPSGSIVAAGGFKEQMLGAGSKSWAWVVKVDRLGCMAQPCLITNVTEIKAGLLPQFWVYPNPSLGQVTFERTIEQANTATALILTDITGKVVWRQQLKEGVLKTIWHTSGMPGGIYFYRLIERGGTEWSGRVVLQK